MDMKTMNLKVVASAILTTVLLLTGILIINNSRAIDSASQLTGECGGVFSMVRKHYVPHDGKSVDVMLHINFDTRLISLSGTFVNVPVGYDGINPNYQVSYTTGTPRLNGGFTIGSGPIPKSFRIIPNQDVDIPELMIMPVNSGNTILIQAKDENVVGMCQKI
jgi:hypothetical protein